MPDRIVIELDREEAEVILARERAAFRNMLPFAEALRAALASERRAEMNDRIYIELLEEALAAEASAVKSGEIGAFSEEQHARIRAALASESGEGRGNPTPAQVEELVEWSVSQPESGEGEDWPDEIQICRYRGGVRWWSEPAGYLPANEAVEVRRYVPAPEGCTCVVNGRKQDCAIHGATDAPGRRTEELIRERDEDERAVPAPEGSES